MKRSVGICMLLGALMGSLAGGAVLTEAAYEARDLGGGRWEYTYAVSNLGLVAGIGEFTFWFEPELYANLAVTTMDSQLNAWDQIVWQPEPVLGDAGAFDALGVGTQIAVGETVGGFSVAFDWLGTGTPGAQAYEIIDPETFETLDTGFTVPEPVTLTLLWLGGALMRRRG